jgi:predicted nucleic acid-binding protein
MITAVDTSVLLDVFTDSALFRDRSLAALRQGLAAGSLIACDVVWAEVVAAFADDEAASRAMGSVPVAYSALEPGSASRAGSAWRTYRQLGGSRERLVADFIVGAHAIVQADRLLTRDRGFQKSVFTGLTIVDPSH